MRRFWKFASISFVTICLVLAMTVTTFDRLVVLPAIEKANTLLSAAAPSERNPPESLKQLLLSSLGSRVKFLVARDVLVAPPSQIEGMQTTSRQFTELGVGLLLLLHLSEKEILALHVSQAYMGTGVRGFSQASLRYANTPLENVTLAQAARLVVISYAPSTYLSNPERLEHRAQAILSKTSK